ncbi:MAG: hypothetical protein V9G11_03235 [Bifidobacterium adolescentis]
MAVFVPDSTTPRYLPCLSAEMPEAGLMEKSRMFISAMEASVVLPKAGMRLPALPMAFLESTTERSPLATAAVAYGSAEVFTVPSAKVSL